jgi:hypothetical protein
VITFRLLLSRRYWRHVRRAASPQYDPVAEGMLIAFLRRRAYAAQVQVDMNRILGKVEA